MKPLPCRKSPALEASARGQAERGNVMIDALVAFALVGLIGVGPMLVSAKAAVAQRNEKVQQLVAIKLREEILKVDSTNCVAGTVDWNWPLAPANTSAPVVEIEVGCSTLGLSLNGVAVTGSIVTARADIREILGLPESAGEVWMSVNSAN